MLGKDLLKKYGHLLNRRNRLVQQYHNARTGKDKSRAVAKLYVHDEEHGKEGRFIC